MDNSLYQCDTNGVNSLKFNSEYGRHNKRMCTNLTRDFLEICCSIIYFQLHYYDKL